MHPMSSSVAYDLYASYDDDYEIYPDTRYVDGDVKFKDLKTGNKMYFCNEYEIKEMIVDKPLYETKGHLYIKYHFEGKKAIRTINFGPIYSADVMNAYENNVVDYTIDHEDGIIATSRETVKSETIKIYEDKIQNLEIEIEDLQSYIRGVEEL